MSELQSNINALISGLNSGGVKHAVISPGSRNAPLISAVAGCADIKSYSFVDERSAGFAALGLAKQLKEPVAVVCTSGSALVNLYPAITEAFYMQIPIIVLSADRPPELIDRWDGQAIHQFAVFGSHVKSSLQTPDKLNSDMAKELFQLAYQAASVSDKGIKGPVHINVPLREPLYFAASDLKYPKFEPPNEESKSVKPEISFPSALLNTSKKVMVLNGAGEYNLDTIRFLNLINSRQQVLVLSDLVSGKQSCSSFSNWEALLLNADDQQGKELLPDILVTTGKMIINKSLKKLLKDNTPDMHFHIAENGYCADTFYSSPVVIEVNEEDFFRSWESHLPTPSETSSYYLLWKTLSEKLEQASKHIICSEFNEFQALQIFLNSIENKSITLHVSNSMPVRLLAYSAPLLKSEWRIECNRGVSGIDGCSSTALGMALADSSEHILISGDLAFFYDVNAFLTHELPENLKIVLLNNQGGGIFMNIDGPSTMKHSDPYITTPHELSARHIAAHYGFEYYSAKNEEDLNKVLPGFHQGKGIKLLEISTDRTINSNIFKQYKSIQI